MLDDRIEGVAMYDEQPAAVGGDMDRLVEDLDPAQMQLG